MYAATLVTMWIVLTEPSLAGLSGEQLWVDGLSANLPKCRECRDERNHGRHAKQFFKIVVLCISAAI